MVRLGYGKVNAFELQETKTQNGLHRKEEGIWRGGVINTDRRTRVKSSYYSHSPMKSRLI